MDCSKLPLQQVDAPGVVQDRGDARSIARQIEQRVGQLQVRQRPAEVAQRPVQPADAGVGRPALARQVQPPGDAQHLAEVGQRLVGLAQADADVAQLVVGVHLADGVVDVQQLHPAQVQAARALVAQPAQGRVAGGQEALARPADVPALLVEVAQQLQPFAGRGGRMRPSSHWAAKRRRRRHELGIQRAQQQIALQLVAERPLGLARHGGWRAGPDEIPLGQPAQQRPAPPRWPDRGRTRRWHRADRRAAAPAPPRRRSRTPDRRRAARASRSRSAGLSWPTRLWALASGSRSRLTKAARLVVEPPGPVRLRHQQAVLLVHAAAAAAAAGGCRPIRWRPARPARGQGIRVQRGADEHVHLQPRQRRQIQPGVAARAPAPPRTPDVQLRSSGRSGRRSGASTSSAATRSSTSSVRSSARCRSSSAITSGCRAASASRNRHSTARDRSSLLIGPAGQRLPERALGQAQAEKAAEQAGHLGHPPVAEHLLQLGPEPGHGLRLGLGVGLAQTEPAAQQRRQQRVGLHLVRHGPAAGPRRSPPGTCPAARRPRPTRPGSASCPSRARPPASRTGAPRTATPARSPPPGSAWPPPDPRTKASAKPAAPQELRRSWIHQ